LRFEFLAIYVVNYQVEKVRDLREIVQNSWRLLLLIALFFSLPAPIALAQESQPASGPVYIVQEGDTLWSIAARFGVGVDELQTANGIANASQIAVGDQLVIPGLQGVQGVIVTKSVPFGETLDSLSQRYELAPEVLVRLNRLTSPMELYAGATLILPEQNSANLSSGRVLLAEGQSLLELALISGQNPWTIAQENRLNHQWEALPGQTIWAGVENDAAPTESQADGPPGALPAPIGAVTIEPLSMLQGKVAEVIVQSQGPVELSGTLLDHPLNFFPKEGGGYVALQGIHAMTEPGIYPIELNGTLPDGSSFAFTQMAPVKAVDYPYDQPLAVDPATIDPSVTRPEDAEWTALTATVTPEKLWTGLFKIPSPLEQEYCVTSGDCWSSRFGNRRSYNGSPYNFFHTGLDIVGQTGVEIFAPADGVVVFAGPLTVRGNATMIDHGQGVYTGYMHQSEILVKPGDRVKAGQLIGRVGGTGRVQGPHLHWEVWVGGVQVDPLDWLERVYP
jgi:murein DD-endopeptidase MepM/ murein hydrolase activator NlpD